ncbi:hypothetical protein SLEP1_g25123 [Rubroshorea leprosula]|uniref:Uncharacterized protein n=1 Tax=Rubroshorea leprosula TaxID=152421 RepID=A0AAV5JU01_9ROSI|nr:hypothetical protein SLEP1_g25123 [Rubroshorea leprosula]
MDAEVMLVSMALRLLDHHHMPLCVSVTTKAMMMKMMGRTTTRRNNGYHLQDFFCKLFFLHFPLLLL